MSEAMILAIVQAIAAGIPEIVRLVREGRRIEDIRLSDFVSSDALSKIRQANEAAAEFVEGDG